MNLEEYSRYDGIALAMLVARGEVSAEELSVVARAAIAAVNPTLNAVIDNFDEATESRFSHHGDGKFNGVPFLMKDAEFHLAGMVTDHGSRLSQGLTAAENSHFGDALQQAGFCFLGRTNAPEFSMAGSSENALYGKTTNPWMEGKSAGGSSGGAGAAVAAGMVPIAHGSDTAGSIRSPASWCGVVGLKPSRGLVSCGPQDGEGFFGMTSHFVLTRTIRDTAAMLDILGQPKPGDPFIVERPGRSYANFVSSPLRPLRIGWSAAPLGGGDEIDQEIRAAVKATARALENLGHYVEEAPISIDLKRVDDICMALWCFGFDQFLDQMASAAGREVSVTNVEAGTWRYYEYAQTMDPLLFQKAHFELNRFRRDVGDFMSDYDLLLLPTTGILAADHGTFGMQVDLTPDRFHWHELTKLQYLAPFNLTGQPALSLPLAVHTSGLPIGVQLVGHPSKDQIVLSVAAQLEAEMPWRSRLPPCHISQV